MSLGLSIDGKSLRGPRNGDVPMPHIVSAWNVTKGVTVAQLKTATKSNEIRDIAKMIESMDIGGAVVTTDAVGRQREIVAAVVEKQSDYIVAVKNNQPNLARTVESKFANVAAGVRQGRLQRDITVDKGHGRVETCCRVVANDLSPIESQLKLWSSVLSGVMVESTRQIVNGLDKGERTTVWRYYIRSLGVEAPEFNQRIREHWGIKNKC